MSARLSYNVLLSPHRQMALLLVTVVPVAERDPCLRAAQGIELSNPTPHNEDSMRSGTESYFSEYSGFRSLKQPPPKPA